MLTKTRKGETKRKAAKKTAKVGRGKSTTETRRGGDRTKKKHKGPLRGVSVSPCLRGNSDPKPLRLEWIEAGTLKANPRNWRRHPAGQATALKAVLEDPDVGWAGALLYNERTKRLIDGHARKDAVDPQTPVPVLVGSWSESAEAKLLLTLDPLAGMAAIDADALGSLLTDVDLAAPDLAGLEQYLKGQLKMAQATPCEATGTGAEDPGSKMIQCPECGAMFGG